MPILPFYISKEFLKILILSMSAFIAIYMVVDIFQGIRMLMEYKPPLSLIVRLYILKIPNIISLVTPVVVLLSTLLSLGILARNSEIIAMKSSGVSLYLIVSPILLLAFTIGILSFMSNEYIVPFTNREAKTIETVNIKKKTKKRFFKQNKIWYRSDNAIYNIQFFDPDKNTLKGVTVYYIGDGFKLSRRIEAKEAVWDGKEWKFSDVVENTFTDGSIASKSYKELMVKLSERPDDLKAEERLAEEMGWGELREYVRRLRREGYDPTRFVVDLYSKLSYPFTSLIMAFLGVPFALKSGRSSGIALGVGISVLIGVGYWLIMSFCLSLGRVGAFPPLIAAWGANVVFGLVGAIMMMKVEGD